MNEAKFTRNGSAFAMTCTVEIDIQAKAEIVWKLLTDAEGFARWNSTVSGIEGQIREGERLKLHVPGTRRTFTPRISGVVSERRMIWSDGVPGIFKGVRTFALEPQGENSIRFTMEEQFSGLMFALFKSTMPDFRPIFEAYAGDLKREAERIAQLR